MTDHSTLHSTFVIQRDYPVTPAQVFAAFSTYESKRHWFAESEGWTLEAYDMDFRVGGREHSHGLPPEGPAYAFDAQYQDIVDDERIVFTYDMHLDDRRISVSLTTIELAPTGSGTTLTFTEQGVFLDGFGGPESREIGTGELLDALGAELAAVAPNATP